MNGYVFWGYAITLGGIAFYTVRVALMTRHMKKRMARDK